MTGTLRYPPLTLIHGSGNPYSERNAVTSRADKPTLTRIDRPPAVKAFDRLVEFCSEERYDEALALMLTMSDEEWLDSDRYPYS